jgi:hypothetical protein
MFFFAIQPELGSRSWGRGAGAGAWVLLLVLVVALLVAGTPHVHCCCYAGCLPALPSAGIALRHRDGVTLHPISDLFVQKVRKAFQYK